MVAVFDSVVFALGIFLGVFVPEADPAIALRAYRDAQAIYINADLRGAAGPGFRRLVDAGEPIGVELVVTLRSGNLERTRAWRHSISYDSVGGTYAVSRDEDGRRFETEVREAALELLFAFRSLAVASAAELKGDLTMTAVAKLYLPDSPTEESRLAALWNYKKPAARLLFAEFAELPY